jgi:hypothetical protein
MSDSDLRIPSGMSDCASRAPGQMESGESAHLGYISLGLPQGTPALTIPPHGTKCATPHNVPRWTSPRRGTAHLFSMFSRPSPILV